MSLFCNKWLLPGLVILPLLGGCGGLPTRDDKASHADEEQSTLPPDYENALTLMRGGHYGAAIPVLRAFSEAHPDLAGPCINLGIAYRRTGDPGAALEALDRAVKLNAHNPSAHLQRAILLREQGEFNAALQAYHQALKLKPDYALAHRNIGILYDLYLQQPARALDHYRRYLELVDDADETVNHWVVDLQRRVGSTTARSAE